MAIVFISIPEKHHLPTQKVEPETWVHELLKQDNQLDIRVWPDYGNPEEIDFAIVWKYPVSELKKFPNLKCIASLGAGVDHIVSDPQRPANIPVVRVVDPFMATEMTRYIVTATLMHLQRFNLWQFYQAKSEWHPVPSFSLPKAQVGILGLGFLGQHAAQALISLGIKVCGWSQSAKQLEHVTCYAGSGEFQPFLSQADVLICLLPLTPATENILNKTTFAALPKGAYLINVARGNHLVEEDLLAALDSGHLSGACLDVFREEPLPQDHPFWQHPKIRITPHIASATNPQTVASQIVENYHRMQKGEKLKNMVDLDRGY